MFETMFSGAMVLLFAGGILFLLGTGAALIYEGMDVPDRWVVPLAVATIIFFLPLAYIVGTFVPTS